MFLKWTSRGAVLAPETLQIRLSPIFAGRVAAGAPSPDRALTDDEIDANVRWFATPGPRGRPIAGLVLSGVDRDVADRIALARALGVRRVVVHAEPTQAGSIRGADAIAVAVRSVADAERVRGVAGVHAVVPLEEPVLERLGAILDAIGAERVTLTWPFPVGGQGAAPRAERVVAALVDVIEGQGKGKGKGKDGSWSWELKGLPRCVLGELERVVPDLERRISRTSNRWYVDAGHQRDRAILFVPDVLRLAKREVCRFCVVDPHCDGVAERWLDLGLAGTITPRRA